MTSPRLLFAVLLVTVLACEAAPFFDALYDAINGNGRRSYGYGGYGNYDYGGNNGYYPSYNLPKPVERSPRRQGNSWKEICRVHFPDSISNPGAGGVVCPY